MEVVVGVGAVLGVGPEDGELARVTGAACLKEARGELWGLGAGLEVEGGLAVGVW